MLRHVAPKRSLFSMEIGTLKKLPFLDLKKVPPFLYTDSEYMNTLYKRVLPLKGKTCGKFHDV